MKKTGLDETNAGLRLARCNRVLRATLIAAVVVGVAAVYLGVVFSAHFLWGLLLLVPLLGAALYVSRRRRQLKDIVQVREDWGRPRLDKEGDLKAARMLFDSLPANDSGPFLDEQTWKDLNVDQLYARIDRTYTDPGEAVLYRMLREPLLDREELARRSRAIRVLQGNRELRETAQVRLLRLGHQRERNDLFNLLWQNEFPRTRMNAVLSVMAVAALVSVFIPIVLWSAVLVVVPVGVFMANVTTHYYLKRRIDLKTLSFPYLVSCVKTAGALSMIRDDGTREWAGRLAELYGACRGVVKKARFLFPVGSGAGDVGQMFYEYLNIFFLLEVRAFYGTVGELARCRSELRELYLAVGELDAFQSIASYRASLTACADPEFEPVGAHLDLKGARQPLLDSPVPASISISKNVVVVTGSNMGGKSTFLRTVGDSVLMAQTIATAAADYYRGSLFRIITSISRTDDLIVGKSYYYVEAERILKAIRSLGEGVPTLCIVDELLSGTNSTERLRASEAIVRYLGTQNVVAIVATHDLELTERLNGRCDFYHFSGSVDENGLRFDYVLKPGVATTGNAIALLEYLGYPPEITQEARKRDNNS